MCEHNFIRIASQYVGMGDSAVTEWCKKCGCVKKRSEVDPDYISDVFILGIGRITDKDAIERFRRGLPQ